jgi:formylglycine-generating enzyme required for sulfatase activity
MVPIAPGTFQMGQVGVAEAVHPVTLSTPFWMGKYEVTQAEYVAVVGSNPSFFQGANAPNAPSRPVEQVSWNNAVAYCQALTAIEQAAGRVPQGYQYRLPTEAEWEYCCRAGTTTQWNTGTSLSTSEANFAGALANSTYLYGQTAVVGSYAPNAFGLHDMHGNVFEWCLDSYALYAPGPVTDPFVTGGPFRVFRGGSWFFISTAFICRSAGRNYGTPGGSDILVGFRVVLAPVLVP